MARKQDKWAEVIGKLGLDITQPIARLTAKQLKLAVNEEPRLMASMDSKEALPAVLRENGLFVLPVSRNEYALVRGTGYHELESPGPAVDFPARLPIDLIGLSYGRGESRFLLHAFHSNLLSEFSGVRELYPSILGKLSTIDFRFRIGTSPELEVTKAGMEVDFGFEGPNDLLVIEAKATAHSNFLIRQLYYPYRTFREQTTKAVRPVFFLANPEKREYSLWEYEWENPTDYSSIRPVRSKKYRITEGRPLTERLLLVEPELSLTRIPQADDLDKVAELPFLIVKGLRTAREWAREKQLTPRQGSYYREAAEALGLVRLAGATFELTDAGETYVKSPPAERDEFLALRLLRNRLMNEVLRLALSKGPAGVGDEEVAQVIARVSDLGGSTLLRRAKSVRSYFKWLAKATGAVIVDGTRIYSREGWAASTAR